MSRLLARKHRRLDRCESPDRNSVRQTNANAIDGRGKGKGRTCPSARGRSCRSVLSGSDAFGLGRSCRKPLPERAGPCYAASTHVDTPNGCDAYDAYDAYRRANHVPVRTSISRSMFEAVSRVLRVVDAQNIHDRSMASDRRRQKLPVKESSAHLPQMSQLGKMRPSPSALRPRPPP